MQVPLYKSARKLWDAWNLRGFVLLSLSLQTFLILFAPFRKRTANKLVILIIWSAYSISDWAATFAIGLMSSSSSSSGVKDHDQYHDVVDSLKGFWAPFLLLHLGGPDNITAFALEDNELWLRYLLGFVFQVIAVVYVFFLTLENQHNSNKLWIPTILIFVAGIIKCFERTRALYLASLDRIRNSIIVGKDNPLREFSFARNDSRPFTIRSQTHNLSIISASDLPTEPTSLNQNYSRPITENNHHGHDIELIQSAFNFFGIFKGLLADVILTLKDRKKSQQFFLSINAEEAYMVIEAELNFIYDSFYTKAAVVHTKKGYIFRAISMALLMIGLIYFSLLQKHDFVHKLDVYITYALLIDAICLDAIALLMRILSDWTVMALENKSSSFLAKLLENFVSFKWLSRFRSYTSIEHGISKYYLVMAMRFLFRRWSETVHGFSFTSYSLKKSSQRFGIISKKFVYGLIFKNISNYNNNKALTINQWRIIFLELHQKSLATGDDLETAWNIYLSRGEWVLEKYYSDLDSNILGVLLSSVTDGDGDGDYDESIMMWHFATELCYYTEEKEEEEEEEGEQDHDHGGDEYRECSKLISDYLLYLLVKNPKMISSVAGIAKGKFQETCEEATKFFGQQEVSSPEEYYKRAYDRIVAWTELESTTNDLQVEGGSVVFYGACCLAKTLKELGNKKWEIMCRVLVEMLCYAACHCKAHSHYQQLSEGGQLLTFVWLLMIHFGLWEIYQTSERSSSPE